MSTEPAVVHPKVTAATLGAFFPSLVLAVLTWAHDNPQILAPLPQWAQGLAILVLPPVITFVSGYMRRSGGGTPSPADPVVNPPRASGP